MFHLSSKSIETTPTCWINSISSKRIVGSWTLKVQTSPMSLYRLFLLTSPITPKIHESTDKWHASSRSIPITPWNEVLVHTKHTRNLPPFHVEPFSPRTQVVFGLARNAVTPYEVVEYAVNAIASCPLKSYLMRHYTNCNIAFFNSLEKVATFANGILYEILLSSWHFATIRITSVLRQDYSLLWLCTKIWPVNGSFNW